MKKGLMATIVLLLIAGLILSDEYNDEQDQLVLQLQKALENRIAQGQDYAESLIQTEFALINQNQGINREILEINNQIELTRSNYEKEDISSQAIGEIISGLADKIEKAELLNSQLNLQFFELMERKEFQLKEQLDIESRVNRLFAQDLDQGDKARMRELLNDFMTQTRMNINLIDNIILLASDNIVLIEENRDLLYDFLKELRLMRKDQIARELFLNEEFIFTLSIWQRTFDEFRGIISGIPANAERLYKIIRSYYAEKYIQLFISMVIIIVFIVFLFIFNKRIFPGWQNLLFAMGYFSEDRKKLTFYSKILLKAVFSVIPIVLTGFAVLVVLLGQDLEYPFLAGFLLHFFIAFALYRFVRYFVHCILDANTETGEKPFVLNKNIASFYKRNIMIILKISFIFYLLFVFDRFFIMEMFIIKILKNTLLLTAIILFYRLLNIDRVRMLTEDLAKIRNPRFLRFLMIVLKLHIIFILLLLISGYINLGLYIIRAMLLSIAVLLISMSIFGIIRDIINKLFEPDKGLIYNYLMLLGYKQKSLNRYRNISTGFFFLIIFIISVLLITHFYGISSRITASAVKIFTIGFTIGDIRLSLVTLTLALLMIIFSQFLSRLLQRIFDAGMLKKEEDEITLQRTFFQLFHYIMIMIGIMLAIRILGFNLTNFAILGGALGVGIGFGLQNIVNNFISGLIIMFEQPVKIGDIIEVGDQRGTVKKINIRSTVIQTFDRTDVILPNSDLISSKVVNWTHNDPIIRVRIEIGIAYGSDIDLVTNLLLDIAQNNEFVLDEPAPKVIFNGFGDSSLDFLLLVYTNIANAFTARSSINYLIDKSFRMNNIEIPFPQRDLHIKAMPGKENSPLSGT